MRSGATFLLPRAAAAAAAAAAALDAKQSLVRGLCRRRRLGFDTATAAAESRRILGIPRHASSSSSSVPDTTRSRITPSDLAFFRSVCGNYEGGVLCGSLYNANNNNNNSHGHANGAAIVATDGQSTRKSSPDNVAIQQMAPLLLDVESSSPLAAVLVATDATLDTDPTAATSPLQEYRVSPLEERLLQLIDQQPNQQCSMEKVYSLYSKNRQKRGMSLRQDLTQFHGAETVKQAVQRMLHVERVPDRTIDDTTWILQRRRPGPELEQQRQRILEPVSGGSSSSSLLEHRLLILIDKQPDGLLFTGDVEARYRASFPTTTLHADLKAFHHASKKASSSLSSPSPSDLSSHTAAPATTTTTIVGSTMIKFAVWQMTGIQRVQARPPKPLQRKRCNQMKKPKLKWALKRMPPVVDGLDDGDPNGAAKDPGFADKQKEDEDDVSAFATDWTRQYTLSTSSSPSINDDGTHLSKYNDRLIVVQPRTVDQVAQIVQYCCTHKIGIVAAAGQTGLVGGSIPASPSHEIVLSMRRQVGPLTNNPSSNNNNNGMHLDAKSGILHCSASCILQTVQEYVMSQSSGTLQVPWDIAAAGSCTMGGNVATNAGGSYYYKHGSIAANLLGLQVVTGQGHVLNLNFNDRVLNRANDEDDVAGDDLCIIGKNTTVSDSSPMINMQSSSSFCNIKDNTGYKLHQMWVGSEGTLGIITGVAVQCRPAFAHRQVAFLASHTWDQLLQTLALAKRYLGETLAAAEYMDGAIVELVRQTYPQLTIPVHLPNQQQQQDPNARSICYPHYLLIETQGSVPEHDCAKMETFLQSVLSNNDSLNRGGEVEVDDAVVANGVLASTVQQARAFWKIRESANPAVTQAGYTYKYDISLPGSHHFAEFIKEMQERVNQYNNQQQELNNEKQPRILLTNWGHLLDGNLHVNFTHVGHFQRCALFDDEEWVLPAVMLRGGSISAEHGIGQGKIQYMNKIHTPAVLDMMRAVKHVWDPAGIMNPDKVLPPSPEVHDKNETSVNQVEE